MKRFLLQLTAVVSLVGVSAFGAAGTSDFDTNIHFGGLIGVGFSNASSNPSANTSARTGLQIGVTMDAPIANGFFISPEINYQMKGAKTAAGAFGPGTPEVTIKTDFITIPVNAKYKFGNFGGFKPWVAAGPFLGFLLSAKASPNGGTDTDIKSTFGSVDFGIDFGLGGSYMVTDSTEMFLTFRYDLGLKNMQANPVGTSSTKTTNIGILVGVLF